MKPLLFNTEMVRAILDGRKTQTREEVAGGFLDENEALLIAKLFQEGKYDEAEKNWGFESPYQVGDILYVTEEIIIDCDLDPWYVADDKYVDAFIDDGTKPYPKLDEGKYGEEYTGIVLAEDMPKECARIFLKVTNCRVETLQNMTDYDLKKEGFNYDYCPLGKPKHIAFKEFDILWNSTAKKGYKWENNPYVFVYEFERIEKPC